MQSDSLEDAQEICADGTYFPNNLHIKFTLTLKWSVFTHTVYLCVPYNSHTKHLFSSWTAFSKGLCNRGSCYFILINLLKPNVNYSGRTASLTSIFYIYSTNISTEYFKHGLYSPFFSLQNAVCFIILTYLVPVLFTFYIQGVLKLKK